MQIDENNGVHMVGLFLLACLATAVRLASDPPATLARLAWQGTAGVGLFFGGYALARATGLEGWAAAFGGWAFAALGAELTLAMVRRILDNRIPK
jgi:uncharacterized membrane protein YhiD involved in acid resistance